jgi:predicted acetyltransferase
VNIDLVEATRDDLPLLEQIGQFYKYDFSEFGGPNVLSEAGRFDRVGFEHIFDRPVHHVFFVRVNGELAGFAAMSEGSSYRDENEVVWYMDEFFVMRRYRSNGVGEHVARMLFERLDGRWEVAQLRANLPAQAFWRKVIGRFTGDDYEEVDIHDGQWDGPVQYFLSKGAT